MKKLFAIDDIRRTNQFLSIFYRALAPLGVRGFEIIKQNYKQGLKDSANSSQYLFEKSIESLGGKDITLMGLKEKALQEANELKESQPSFPDPTDATNGDAQSNYLHDRFLNNMDSAIMDVSNSGLFTRLVNVCVDIVKGLLKSINPANVWKAHAHSIKFASKTTLASMTLAQLLNYMRSLIVFAEEVVGHLVEAVINLLPLYWNLALQIMLTPIYIPFIYGLWSQKFMNGHGKLTILELLTFCGSIYSTFGYKLFNKGRAPFNEKDIEVLATVKEPELFLYTWNNHPSTSAVNSKALQVHRLGIYDWIPRLHMSVLGTMQTVLYDVTLYIGQGTNGNPGVLNRIPQVFNAISGIMGRISGYPFTQLESNDPKKVKHSILNPDSRFIYFWMMWVIEDVVRVGRPLMPLIHNGVGNWLNSGDGFALSNWFIVGLPLTFYGIKVTLDTGKDIADNDYPRRAVLATQWIEVFLNYVDLSFPYWEKHEQNWINIAYSENVVKKLQEHNIFNSQMRLFKFWKDGFVQSMIYTRNTLMTGFHIVGMLSSSYQGGAKEGDGKYPDNIE